MASWRDATKMLTTVHKWLTDGIEQHGNQTMVFIAENEQGKQLGFASVSHSTHFTGEKQAYIGELVVDETVEASGVGSALINACEEWAVSHGYKHLVLETGAANTRARGFYQHLGFLEEDVKLVKQL
jgi:GNAT superfamily N-acetyltransferase